MDPTPAPQRPFLDRPNRLPLPPIIFVACLLGAYGLDQLMPLPALLPPTWMRLKGALMIGAGLALVSASAAALARGRTTILPHRGATRLVTEGPFSLSRNPIYLANALIMAGFGGLSGSHWYDVAAITCLVLDDRLAVRREEAHLAARFGEDWRAYAARVRRWI
ncbi:MAG: isoprenylcysteine carboxylmethyltransferase family protein [Piscinibacter sp.]